MMKEQQLRYNDDILAEITIFLFHNRTFTLLFTDVKMSMPSSMSNMPGHQYSVAPPQMHQSPHSSVSPPHSHQQSPPHPMHAHTQPPPKPPYNTQYTNGEPPKLNHPPQNPQMTSTGAALPPPPMAHQGLPPYR